MNKCNCPPMSLRQLNLELDYNYHIVPYEELRESHYDEELTNLIISDEKLKTEWIYNMIIIGFNCKHFSITKKNRHLVVTLCKTSKYKNFTYKIICIDHDILAIYGSI